MPVGTARPSATHRPSRWRTLLHHSLALSFALVAATGCNKGAVCKDPYITTADRCAKCTPWDDEVLARINPTELPFQVRDAILACAEQSRPKSKTDHTTFLTQEALLDCVGRDPSVDAETRSILAKWVGESNLMRRVDQDNHAAICSANDTGPVPMPPAATDSAFPGPVTPAAPTVPGMSGGLDSPMVPMAAPAPVPVATPAAIPTPPAAPTRPSPPLRPAGAYRPSAPAPTRLPPPTPAPAPIDLPL